MSALDDASGSSSTLRAKAAAWMKLEPLYACAMAKFSASTRCAGCRRQCVKYAESSICRGPGAVVPLSSLMRTAVTYSLEISRSSFTSAASARFEATTSGIDSKMSWKRSFDSLNWPFWKSLYADLSVSTRLAIFTAMMGSASSPALDGGSSGDRRESGMLLDRDSGKPGSTQPDAARTTRNRALSGTNCTAAICRCSSCIADSNDPAATWSAAWLDCAIHCMLAFGPSAGMAPTSAAKSPPDAVAGAAPSSSSSPRSRSSSQPPGSPPSSFSAPWSSSSRSRSSPQSFAEMGSSFADAALAPTADASAPLPRS
mmetsp:Transcript_8577/g.28226  ORF Transcript_8577/g.28226 Transcript_8577/m.28226 type:complete len:314 (+) Transcript_8577:570-1511(+)